MEVDRTNRNCYNYKNFGHMIRNCRNKRTEDKIREGRRLEYENENNGQRRMIKG